MDSIQLIWSNWNQVCDFVDLENFIQGTYTEPGEKGLGLLMRLEPYSNIVLVKETDWILRLSHQKYKIIKNTQYQRLKKLEYLCLMTNTPR